MAAGRDAARGMMAARSWMVWLAAAFSGAAALAYEICWSRALVVPLGNAMDAAAMVLAGFMLGIGIGGRLGGGLAERSHSPLKLYALVEAALGAYAAIAPPLLGFTIALPTPWRHLAALVLIATPGMAMGASLPLLTRALTAGRDPVARHISVLYGVNTAGAAVGATATGFWGIALLGVGRSSLVAAGASLFAALIALVAARRSRSADPLGKPPPPRGHRRLALIAAFTSGLAMLASETLWARLLTFVFGHDTYAFASLLTIVLLGLALGGLLHRALAGRDQRALLGGLLGAFAVAVPSSFWIAGQLVIDGGRDPFGLTGRGRLATSVWLELYRELAFTPFLILVPSLLAGAIFPAACCLYAGRAEDGGRSVGVIALVNGLGSACGAVLAPLGLVALVGLQPAYALVGLVAAAAGSAVLWGPRARPRLAALLPLGLAFTVVMALPADLPRRMLLRIHGERHWRLAFYEEGRVGTVSVIDNLVNGERQLLMNGLNEVTTRLVHDQSFKMLGQLAPLLHPDPKTGVMICLGAGLSAGSALAQPLERLDVIDLSTTVAGGARLFAEQNNGVLDDPRLRLHVGDGRHHLLETAERYDVAIVDSTHPKSVDSWILYTREFYELLRARLAPGGIAVQWLPLHGLSEREFQIIVRTFAAAFPKMTLWANVGYETYGQVAYAKLVGPRDEALEIDLPQLRGRLARPEAQADLARYGLSSAEELLDNYLCDAAGVDAWTAGLPLQTDDHPLVPYTTPFTGGRPMTPPLLLAARQPLAKEAPFSSWSEDERRALEVAREAQGMVTAGLLDRAAELRPGGHKIRLYLQRRATTAPYHRAVAERYADDAARTFAMGTQLGQLGHPEHARGLLERVLELRPGHFGARLNLALLASARGEHEAALAELSRLRAEQPRSAIVLHNLGAAVLASGDPGVAAVHLRHARSLDPASVAAGLSLARAHLAAGDDESARRVLEELLAEHPQVGSAHALLGEIAHRRNDLDAAVDHQRLAVQRQPYDLRGLHHLAATHRARGEAAEARRVLDRALRIAPNDAALLTELGALHAEAGRFEIAADLHLQALEADPMSARAALHLGQALRGQKREREAVGALCLALRLEPALAPAKRELRDLGEGCDLR